ncbi:MAG: hypothetical protein JO053_10750 [Acidobacteria bacterium]|nr:hypothetical protein [Acidobacteriota bacterium]
MIAGFNTDIEFDGTVYHVQTEDKGAPHYMIMSLVYDKGTILASKRVKYDELGPIALDEKELAERVSRQHKLICAAVKAGRITELKQMTAKTAAAGKAKAKPVPAAVPAIPGPGILLDTGEVIKVFPDDLFDDVPVIDPVAIIEEEILPDDAVAVVSELSGKDRPAHEKLTLELLGETKFKGGERKTVNIMVCRGTSRKVVPEAQIMVKVLGSAFRPVIFHARTDANGLAKVHLQLPQFSAGRAALLVRALVAGEEIELRRLVTPG